MLLILTGINRLMFLQENNGVNPLFVYQICLRNTSLKTYSQFDIYEKRVTLNSIYQMRLCTFLFYPLLQIKLGGILY